MKFFKQYTLFNLLYPALFNPLAWFFCIALLCFSVPQTTLAAPKKISQLEFRDISVGDALRILADQSNINVIASEEAAKIKMTLYLKNISAMDVLEAMAKTYNLWYQKDPRSGVIRVYTVDEFRLGKVDYKNEQTKIYTFKHERNALDFAYIIQDLYGQGRVRLSSGADESEIMDDLLERLDRFELIANKTTNLGGGRSSASSGSGSGSGSNRGSRRGNNNNRGSRGGNQSNRNRNGSTQSIDSQEIVDFQNMLPDNEAKALFSGQFSRGNRSMSNLVQRLSPIYVTRIKRQNRVLIRTRDQDALKEINSLYHQVDTELATVLMEVKLLQIDLSDGYDSLFDFKIKSDKTSITKGQSATSALSSALNTVSTAFNPALLATYISDKFEARLQLLEQENRVTEVATPILLTTNQEVSRVFIGEERPIVTGYEESNPSITTTTNDNTTTTSFRNFLLSPINIPQTEVRNLGTTLLLTPNINADNTVSIRILIEQSNLSPTPATIPVQVGDQLMDADIDVVQTKTFSGTIVAQNGSAIAVGGLIEDRASDIESKVPILGDIPGIGFFFREQSKLRKRTELVVIIRPYITTTPEKTAEFSRKYLQENSLHPNVPDTHNMDIYSNKDRRHKGYQLEQPYKEYDAQDKMDRFQDKGERTIQRQSSPSRKHSKTSKKQQIYVDLTQYAAKSVRLAASEREVVSTIKPVSLNNTRTANLLYDTRIKAVPVASWHQGGIHVTAVALYNLSDSPVTVDFKHLKGKWLASSIESVQLGRQGAPGDQTYLYLVSAGSFIDISERIKLSKK